MSTGTLLAACRLHALLPTTDATGVTAIDKRAVEGPVQVHALGLTADLQADRKHHGGESKALYAYSQEDAAYWEAELGEAVPPGRFGENLRIAGLDASRAVVGERWQIGAGVVLEVTCPRTPCRNFAQYMNQPRWVARFAAAGRLGTYLRVIKRGTIQAGDTINVIHRPEHGVTVADVFTGPTPRQRELLQEAGAAGAYLSPEIRKVLARKPAVPAAG
ncbi:MOSC domain-containing protein [Arthrobacter sp. Sa2CUA1]|uniref:MOSC domain-containing protein n=1 Tax=Arthrobacter gallicola TaxID=2762225 RepID=A0ABR8UR95_9MICC|nr:MOSC domain-containing protein [Arthrobacter gallicola]MBD7995084.1 MOSC domain-containing protein [Arthrobacter gallicola]